jgi:multisubunit Na+/H+ antiporter MnhB subunit
MNGSVPGSGMWGVALISVVSALIAIAFRAYRGRVTNNRERELLMVGCRVFGFAACVLTLIFIAMMLFGETEPA